jgi:tRNA 2-thiouridine synthesizing protein A
MDSDEVLKVLATDKEAPADFAVFCRQTGNQLISSELNGDEFIFYIRRR